MFNSTRERRSESGEAPEYLSCEMFLEQTGFFSPSSKRINHLFTKVKAMRRRSGAQGSAKPMKLTIDALQRFGLPVTFDQDIYRAFLKICDEEIEKHGHLREPIKAPSKLLLRYAGKSAGQRDRAQVQEWFEVMRGTQLKGEIYNHRKGQYEALISGVFAQVVVRGESLPDGETATSNYVWLSPWFKDNYESGYTRRFDLTFYQQLRKPIAKALYPMLEIGWFAASGKTFSKSYAALCEDFLITRHLYIARVRQQLDPGHEELKRLGFLREWKYESSKNGLVIHYEPGRKFFTDQCARARRRRRGAPNPIGEQTRLILQQGAEVERERIIARSREIGESLRRKGVLRRAV